mgnify:CR=1 FL=1|jgi:hypothetical protein
MSLVLRREPANRFDPNAIAAYVRARALLFFSAEVQIGYLNAELAPEMARYIDKGGTLNCSITEVTGGGKGKPTLGVNVLLTKA